MKDSKQKKGFFSRLFHKDKKTATQPSREEVLMSYIFGRVIPAGEGDRHYRAFTSRTYKTTYEIFGAGTYGKFMVHYFPTSKLLAVSLPVFFQLPPRNVNRLRMMYNEEIALFKRAIHDAWSRKYKFRTKALSDNEDYNVWDELNEVSVDVHVMQTMNTEKAFFKIAASKKDKITNRGISVDSYRKRNDYEIPGSAYEKTLESQITPRGGIEANSPHNQYAYVAGQMFGIGDETNINTALVAITKAQYENARGIKRQLSKPTIPIYDPATGKSRSVSYSEVFKVRDKYFKIEDGRFWRTDEAGNIHGWIKPTSPSLAGCIGTSTFAQSLTFIDKRDAIRNALLDENRKLKDDSLMAGGRTVQKRHYVNFLQAMIYAIKETYPDKTLSSEKGYAPNISHDWLIVD